MTKVLSKYQSESSKMAESTQSDIKDLLKYSKEPPEDPEKMLPWLLDINEEFFSQELSRVVSFIFQLILSNLSVNLFLFQCS